MTPSEPTDVMGQLQARQEDKLLRDLILAERDVLGLAAAHGKSLDELAAWFDLPGKRQTVSKICRLADLQCQVMVSRYRLIAVSRLIAQAGNDDGTLGPEQVRKACVDLLKAKLTNLDPPDDDKEASDDPALTLLQEALAAAGEET